MKYKGATATADNNTNKIELIFFGYAVVNCTSNSTEDIRKNGETAFGSEGARKTI